MSVRREIRTLDFRENLFKEDGFKEGDIVVITGMNGCGKTRLLQSLREKFPIHSVELDFYHIVKANNNILSKIDDKLQKKKILTTLIRTIDKYNSKLILMDNFGDGLHPDSIEEICGTLKEIFADRLIITATHNPMVLIGFGREDGFYLRDNVLLEFRKDN